ncbi:hypothetical protein AV521_41475 [Streptomyces sp. IMTB 2501]|uniref:LysR family transcriptional regulator n=1 Tax=Streptomyces sp. IMTB 2501 TaxID=1776340 RepID=UPI00096F5C2C|nr:LysR family transcriptional regulator [Streptomyces sp. IMTB 2501]OLZ62595.1 hypothetical protein AV521_41475 [Streptomyces sp. IMTB 2501]
MTGKRVVSSIEIRHLKAFLALVEHGSFRRASAALWISQPALSRTVAQLEHLLGEKLIVRGNLGVQLSAAGSRFLPHANRTVAAVEDAVGALSSLPALRVGFTWNALGAHTGPLINEFEKKFPDSEVELLRIDELPYAGIEDGRSHLAILRSVPLDSGIAYSVLFEEPRLAVLPREHPLAGEPSVTLAGIRSDPLVVNTVSGTTSADLWGRELDAERALVGVRNLEEWLHAVAAGRGIGITPASTAVLHPHPLVAYRPLRGVPPVPVLLAWPMDRPHPLVADFVELARQHCHDGSFAPDLATVARS